MLRWRFRVVPCFQTPSTTAEQPATSSVVDTQQPSTSKATSAADDASDEALSRRLQSLNELWDLVSVCLTRLGKASDPHAVLALQPAAEAFFLVHAVPTASPVSTAASVSAAQPDPEKPQNAETSKLIHFAGKGAFLCIVLENGIANQPGIVNQTF